MPAFTDMLPPLYVVLGVVLLVVTWKWFRWRARHRDRRHTERRHTERRDDVQDDASPIPPVQDESVGR